MAREIKLLKVKLEDEDIELDYKEQYLHLIKKPINGMTIDEMEVSIRIISKLRSACSTDKVVLEEDEWNILNNLIKANRWALVCPEIVDMIKNITEAKQRDLY